MILRIIAIAIAIFYFYATGKNIKDGDNKNAIYCAIISAACFYYVL